jgi:flagellar hook-length control protein FliK
VGLPNNSLAVRVEHPQLGAVDVRVQVQGAKVAAAFGVGSEFAQTALLANTAHLAQSLRQHGLQLGGLQVATGSGGGGTGSGPQGRGPQAPAASAPRAQPAPPARASPTLLGRLDVVV